MGTLSLRFDWVPKTSLPQVLAPIQVNLPQKCWRVVASKM